jgi:hypothetical protein
MVVLLIQAEPRRMESITDRRFGITHHFAASNEAGLKDGELVSVNGGPISLHPQPLYHVTALSQPNEVCRTI